MRLRSFENVEPGHARIHPDDDELECAVHAHIDDGKSFRQIENETGIDRRLLSVYVLSPCVPG